MELKLFTDTHASWIYEIRLKLLIYGNIEHTKVLRLDGREEKGLKGRTSVRPDWEFWPEPEPEPDCYDLAGTGTGTGTGLPS